MTPEQLEEIKKLARDPKSAAFHDMMARQALPLVKALEEAWEALDEREGDMHARIRAGYDKTVADMWRAHCAKIEKERDEARAEVERLREVVKNSFTLDQITETMRTAINVCTGYSPPMPRRHRTRCKPPPICPSCRCNAVYISGAPSDSLLPELRPMECLKCSHKWTAFFEQDGG